MKRDARVWPIIAVFIGAALLCAHGLMADEAVKAAPASQSTPAAEAAQTPILDSYGDTQIINADPVRNMFSHKTHVVQHKLACASCHPALFERKWGAALAKGDYTMASLEKGVYCGACHHDGKTAFNVTGPETCVRCHGSNMQPPDMVIFQQPVKTVAFDHKWHVERGMKCSDCHQKLFENRKGAAEEKPEKFTMEALYAGKYCGGCHDGKNAFASDTRCTTCHVGIKGYGRDYAKQAAQPAAEHHKK